MIVKIINIDGDDKEILVYDVYQQILDKFSDTEEEEAELDQTYMTMVTPEYMSLLALRDKSLITIKKTNYFVAGEPELNIDEGEYLIFVEPHKATKSKKKGGFGGRSK